MRFLLPLLVILILVGQSVNAFAQEIKQTVLDGGNITDMTAYRNDVEEDRYSSLKRSWINIDDSTCPVQLSNMGLLPNFSDRSYVATGSVVAKEDVSAFEVLYLLYDVFGEHMATLSTTVVADLSTEKSYDLKKAERSWHASVNDIYRLYNIVIFVTNVRTAKGKVWHYRSREISDELKKIELKVSADMFEPTKDK
ncbi:MAG: hypothetical protein PHD91_08480 [bacterium]|jgi:hypothetical protein|nr:hypothetical protein [bacterium]